MNPLAIVDYGAGNLRSVEKAFLRLGHDAVITSDPQRVAEAPAVVFPGQGASPPAMATLERSGLADALRQAINRDTPFFGVCLGLQLLMEWSEEGSTPCLGILQGTTRRLPEEPALSDTDRTPMLRSESLPKGRKIPHMGWNSVRLHRTHPLFADVPQESFFYFVHSYYADPSDQECVLGTTGYGVEFCSVAARENVVATQFHPEKSGPLGLRLYDNFVRYLVRRETAKA